jgi:hypothetical protein
MTRKRNCNPTFMSKISLNVLQLSFAFWKTKERTREITWPSCSKLEFCKVGSLVLSYVKSDFMLQDYAKTDGLEYICPHCSVTNVKKRAKFSNGLSSMRTVTSNA